jgi:hypothetical protein
LTDGLHRNAIAGPIQPIEIIRNLFPIDDSAVISGSETENRARRRNISGGKIGGSSLSVCRYGQGSEQETNPDYPAKLTLV